MKTNEANYKKIDAGDIDFFRSILGQDCVLTDSESLQDYGHDQTEDFVFDLFISNCWLIDRQRQQ